MTQRRQSLPAGAGLALMALLAFAGQGMPAAWACGPWAELRFTEAWPDTFEIFNRSPPGWAIEAVRIDLAGSTGGLFFDPEDMGPGGGMYDPLRPQAGPARLTGVSAMRGGDTSVTLSFDGFVAGSGFVFTVDVDGRDGDRVLSVVPRGATRGAVVEVRFVAGAERASAQGRFDGGDVARTVDGSACG